LTTGMTVQLVLCLALEKFKQAIVLGPIYCTQQ